ncbi:DUF4158 domain-containing protein [Streptomyces sp. NPDC005349]|uniref:DUF4158 domain-containing protein n=1 Tax=Streptomyces sp. NPDC005349 TaxID=3157037 RepID=UPI0033AA8199
MVTEQERRHQAGVRRPAEVSDLARPVPQDAAGLPPDAVEHVAKQVGVAATELVFYDFTSRAAKRHRSELRDLTGWHECTTTDQVKLVSQLVYMIWHDERRAEQIRSELLRQMREDLTHRRLRPRSTPSSAPHCTRPTSVPSPR